HARARGLCRPRAAARPAAPGRGRDRRPGARPARPRAGVSGAYLMTAFWTLFMKETMRFWKVAMQTVAAPVLTSLLYLVIFGYVFSGRVQVYAGVSYASFLVPGLLMMSVLQNAFASSSSSLIQAKM